MVTQTVTIVSMMKTESMKPYTSAEGDNRTNYLVRHAQATYLGATAIWGRTVELVVPERSKNKIHLNEDRSKWKNASERDEHRWPRIPAFVGDEPRDRIDAARVVWSAGPITAENGAQYGEGQRNERPD